MLDQLSTKIRPKTITKQIEKILMGKGLTFINELVKYQNQKVVEHQVIINIWVHIIHLINNSNMIQIQEKF